MKIKGMVDCFLPCESVADVERVLPQLRHSKVIHHIFLLVKEAEGLLDNELPNCTLIATDNVLSSTTMELMVQHTEAEFALLCLKTTPFTIGYKGLERMVRVAQDTAATLFYSDHYSV